MFLRMHKLVLFLMTHQVSSKTQLLFGSDRVMTPRITSSEAIQNNPIADFQ